MNTLYIVIPAYNESENIERLIYDWYPIIEKHNDEGLSRLVIVNDGSKDDTYKIMCNMARVRPLLIPLTKENGGHGDTVLYGYRYAIDNGADYIFQTDSDGQTNPNEFAEFWDSREDYSAIFGNRTVREDGQSRAFVEKVLCLFLKVFFSVSLPDANAPFRLMKADYVKKYIQRIPENYNLPNVMLTMFGKFYNEKIKFIEITFKPRQGGTNSINIKRIVKIGMKAIKDFGDIRKGMK